MKVSYLKLDSVNILLSATVEYGEEYTGPLNVLAVLGYFNDGINYSYTDKNGNKYIKSGNTATLINTAGRQVSATASEGRPFLRIGRVGGDYTVCSSRSNTRESGEIRTVAMFGDASAYSSWISSNYAAGKAVSAILVTKNLKCVWTGKHKFSSWMNSKVTTGDCFSDSSSNLIPLNVDGVLVEGGTLDPDDPYSPGGSSETGGGTGTFDRTGDDIGVPSLPTLSAVSTGFVTLYNPTLGQLNDLASYMWSDLFDINTFKKIFADPMDVILGLSIVPVSVPDGGSVDVKVGNISTGVIMNKAASQFVHVSCGSLEIKEYWGAYLDFAPYTKAEIYLPYCGSHPIDIDEIMGKTISVDYNIDIFSGACCAMIKCGNSVLYHFLGQCSQSIPISGNDWSQFISNAIRAAASIGTMVATAGASAPATAAGSLARTTSQISSGASTAESIVSMKPSIEKSGAMCGCGGMLGVQTPYITFNFPRQCLPKGQNTIIGYPTYITYTLGDLSGYTIVDDLHLTIDTATNQEKDEIEELLKGGVIL